MDTLIKYTGVTSADIFAMLAGALICIGLTQALKQQLLLSHRQKQALAFCIGALATYTLVPPPGLIFDWKSLWLGIIVGLMTPTGFRILKIIGKQRGWEWLDSL